MSYPILYSATETEYKTQGLGVLSDALECTVTEERNGIYELEMVYPVSGVHYESIKLSAQILAVSAYGEKSQPFRIYKISKPISGKVTISAEHISYQLSCIPVMPFAANNCAEAMNGLVANAAEDCPFTVYTDKDVTAAYNQTEPASFRSRLAGTSGSILDLYGPGDFKFDRHKISFLAHRGEDRGVVIEYGKNLTDLKQEESIENTVTGIAPFWKSTSEDKEIVVTLPEKVVESESSDKFPFKRTVVHDFSSDFNDQPTVEQLRAKAQSYVKSNLVGVPSIDLDVSFVNLADTEEYKGLASEQINLCDTVTVRFPALSVETKAKVVKTVWDVLADRYESISLSSSGSPRADLSKTINEIAKTAEEKPSVSFLDAAIKHATDLISGGLGGHVITNYVNGYPSEILIMDTDSISTAKNVLRINQNGIGFSKNGYNGPFNTAWTIDGKFNADFITSGIINANLIKAGVIQDAKSSNWWNLESGEVHISAVDSLGKSLSDAKSEWQQTANGISQTVSSNYERTVTGYYEEFAQGDSDTTAPVNGWSTTQPERKDGKYIWRRTVTTFGDGTTSTSPGVCITGPKGDKGDTGPKGATGPQGPTGAKGDNGDSITITSSSTTYATSTTSTQPADSAFTATSIPTLAAGDYLWTKVVTNFSDGKIIKSYSVSRIGADGKTGATGANGKTTHWAYATSADGKTGFSTIMFSGATYVGTYDDTNQADSTDCTKYKWTKLKGDAGATGAKGDKGDKGATGPQGPTGAKGADGKGIKSTSVTYQAAPTQTVTPTGTWSGSVPSLSESNPYLWTRTVITYTDNTTSTSYSVSSAITDPRINSTIIKHEQEYYLSTSDTSLAGGSWSTTFPTRKTGTFYWVRYKDTHANKTVTYDPSANGKLLTEVNEVWNSVVSNQTAINSSNAQINMVATSVTSVKNDLGKKADTESINSSMDKLSSTVTDIGRQIADLKVQANSIEASVTEVNNLAQTTKKATAALTADGLSVDTGQTTKSVVDGTGLTITSKADNSVVAKFTTGESEIQNLKIDGFMKLGAHTVQKMQDTEWDGTTVNGTGWMWNGG